MSTEETSNPAQPPKRARRSSQTAPPANINPPATQPSLSVRFDAMTQGRIDSLESDKKYFRERCEQLEQEVNRLLPENARLRELVKSASTLDVVSLVLIGLGGGVISYATFISPGMSATVADAGLGSLLSGTILLFAANIVRWFGLRL